MSIVAHKRSQSSGHAPKRAKRQGGQSDESDDSDYNDYQAYFDEQDYTPSKDRHYKKRHGGQRKHDREHVDRDRRGRQEDRHERSRDRPHRDKSSRRGRTKDEDYEDYENYNEVPSSKDRHRAKSSRKGKNKDEDYEDYENNIEVPSSRDRHRSKSSRRVKAKDEDSEDYENYNEVPSSKDRRRARPPMKQRFSKIDRWLESSETRLSDDDSDGGQNKRRSTVKSRTSESEKDKSRETEDNPRSRSSSRKKLSKKDENHIASSDESVSPMEKERRHKSKGSDIREKYQTPLIEDSPGSDSSQKSPASSADEKHSKRKSYKESTKSEKSQRSTIRRKSNNSSSESDEPLPKNGRKPRNKDKKKGDHGKKSVKHKGDDNSDHSLASTSSGGDDSTKQNKAKTQGKSNKKHQEELRNLRNSTPDFPDKNDEGRKQTKGRIGNSAEDSYHDQVKKKSKITDETPDDGREKSGSSFASDEQPLKQRATKGKQSKKKKDDIHDSLSTDDLHDGSKPGKKEKGKLIADAKMKAKLSGDKSSDDISETSSLGHREKAHGSQNGRSKEPPEVQKYANKKKIPSDTSEMSSLDERQKPHGSPKKEKNKSASDKNKDDKKNKHASDSQEEVLMDSKDKEDKAGLKLSSLTPHTRSDRGGLGDKEIQESAETETDHKDKLDSKLSFKESPIQQLSLRKEERPVENVGSDGSGKSGKAAQESNRSSVSSVRENKRNTRASNKVAPAPGESATELAAQHISKSLIELTALSDRLKYKVKDRNKDGKSSSPVPSDVEAAKYKKADSDNNVMTRKEPDGESVGSDEDKADTVGKRIKQSFSKVDYPKEENAALQRGLDAPESPAEDMMSDDGAKHVENNDEKQVMDGKPIIDLSHRRKTDGQLIRSIFIARGEDNTEVPNVRKSHSLDLSTDDKTKAKGSFAKLLGSCCGLKKTSFTS